MSFWGTQFNPQYQLCDLKQGAPFCCVYWGQSECICLVGRSKQGVQVRVQERYSYLEAT